MKQSESGGGIVLNKNRDVLVVNQNENSWSLPKGRLDPGEDALAAAKREIFEESGVSKLNLIKQCGVYQRFRIGFDGGEDKSEFKTITMFIFTTDQMDLQPQDSNNPEAKWVTPDQVESILTHPKDKAFFSEILHELADI